jgi:hypothetical protein
VINHETRSTGLDYFSERIPAHVCNLLNDDGVPLELIADMLGHTTTAMLSSALSASGPSVG